jgi:filamentous hemagglutinin family protein
MLRPGLLLGILVALGASPAAAGPEGASVVGGAATIQGQGGPAVIVNQSTSSAIINWNTFNIRANESVRFNQPSASSVALNRVVGGLGPSEIMGSLTANGRVFIINHDGILFGPGSVVNTAGFLATTNDIKNADFMAGRYNFNIPGRPDASIVNKGTITASSGGFAALVAPGVRNSGTITATLGTVALTSGNSFTLDMYGDKLITLAVGDSIANKVIDVATGKPLKSLVSNTRRGVISANGGRVELTAAAARAVVDSVINTKGVIRADSIGRHNGMIVLNAATGGSKPAGAPAQTIKLAGTISAAGRHRGTTGGTIVVSGEHIKIANAKIDASGRRGGGKVMIGGDWGGGHPDLSLVNNASAKLENYTIATATTVSVDAKTTINASATGRGNGGKVVLWSDSETTFAGTILAKGGAKSGDGGFVEISSHGQLNYTGLTDTRAPKGAVGTLLLDPFDILISNSPTSNGRINAGAFTPTGNSSVLNATDLAAALAFNNVIVTTGGAGSPGSQAGDITVETGVTLVWAPPTILTLSAFHDINIAAGVNIANLANGSVVLSADSAGIGSGTINLASGPLPVVAPTVGNLLTLNPASLVINTIQTQLPLLPGTLPLTALLQQLNSLVSPQTQVVQNLVGNVQVAALTATPAVTDTIQGGIRLPQQQPVSPPGPQQLVPGVDRRIIDVPRITETRLIRDEVILQVATNVSMERLQTAMRQFGLTLIASQTLASLGKTVVRFRITDGKSPAQVIRALAAVQIIAVAQPNYIYTLQQPAPSARPQHGPAQGDPAQYTLAKLKISEAHQMVRGANVSIAVIDSAIDVTHPDLLGAVSEQFRAIEPPEPAHVHGTAMAGAIAARQKLLGIAPAARLFAVQAFSDTGTASHSNTFNILKGLDWSIVREARIINMSFAGPPDPSLERALKFAYDKGIVLVAAGGNAGPNSPPLFPGANPLVIAVTATDVEDKLFSSANRGKYISVAAPGVDILVPAPDSNYQFISGTSVAAAEVSGVVALLLERNPKLKPVDVRRILTASAKRMGPGDRDDNFGYGLIDPLKALQLADPRVVRQGF